MAIIKHTTSAGGAMGRLILALMVGSVLTSCSAYKTAQRELASGDYRDALETLEAKYPDYKNPAANVLRRQIQEELRKTPADSIWLGTRQFAGSRYEDALDSYGRALTGHVVPDLEAQAKLGMCDALLQLPTRLNEAEKACIAAGPQRSEQLRTVRERLLDELGEQFAAALSAGDFATATKNVWRYSVIPGSDAGLVEKWTSDLTRARAAAEAAQKERAERERRETLAREAAEKKQRAVALATLRGRYSGVRGLSKRGFEQWVLSSRTVLGAAIFSKVEIVDQQLRMWVSDGDYISANMNHFADYCSAFIAWCGCDGRTVVGVDMSYLGGAKIPMFGFGFSPAAEQCVMGR